MMLISVDNLDQIKMKGNTSNLEKIQGIFSEHFVRQNIHLPEENLRERKKGSLPYGSGRIFFIFGEENGREYLEYYAHHRIGGDSHTRIYDDGTEESLNELVSSYAYNPAVPGDKEIKEAQMKKEYQETLEDLMHKGMFSDDAIPGDIAINSYLVLHGDALDKEDE